MKSLLCLWRRQIIDRSPPTNHDILIDHERIISHQLSFDNVYNVLCKLDPSKSPGPDEETTRLLKELALELAGPLTCLFNRFLASGQFPEKWKDSNLTPVYKSGAKDSVNNYR